MKHRSEYKLEQIKGLYRSQKRGIRTVSVPKVEQIATNNLKVEKIELSDDYTRIDIMHYADPKYISGGWVHVRPETFIRASGSTQRLGLLNVINVPIARAKHYYRHVNDRIAFSLFFPALPKNVKSIDMIEKPNGGENYFNIYGIRTKDIDNGDLRFGFISLN